MLNRIRALVSQLFKAQTTTPQTPQPVVGEYASMRPTGKTANVGGTDYPVFHERGNQQPHVLAGCTFVPLSVFPAPVVKR
jgi:hypothetical protein